MRFGPKRQGCIKCHTIWHVGHPHLGQSDAVVPYLAFRHQCHTQYSIRQQQLYISAQNFFHQTVDKKENYLYTFGHARIESLAIEIKVRLRSAYSAPRVLTGGFAELSAFFRPHSNPGTVREYADNDTLPGVNETVRQIDDGPHSECSAIIFAWVVTSVGDKCGSSSACVFIQPRGSKSFNKKSSLGSWAGSSTVLLLPRCGIHAMAWRITEVRHWFTATQPSENVYLDLFYLLVIRWRCSVKIGRHLSPQISTNNKCSQDVLR